MIAQKFNRYSQTHKVVIQMKVKNIKSIKKKKYKILNALYYITTSIPVKKQSLLTFVQTSIN